MDDFTNAFRGGYRRRALFVQENVILLFGAVAFAAASASWLPLAAGAALELAWLLTAPWLPAFRRRVDARLDVEPVLDPPQSPLDAAYGERARRLGPHAVTDHPGRVTIHQREQNPPDIRGLAFTNRDQHDLRTKATKIGAKHIIAGLDAGNRESTVVPGVGVIFRFSGILRKQSNQRIETSAGYVGDGSLHRAPCDSDYRH